MKSHEKRDFIEISLDFVERGLLKKELDMMSFQIIEVNFDVTCKESQNPQKLRKMWFRTILVNFISYLTSKFT